MKLYFFSFGCKVNQVEFENLKTEAGKYAMEVVDTVNESDAVVINSCAVTDKAVRKFETYISRIKHSNSNIKIFVTGCVAELKKDQLKNIGVDLVITNAGKSSIFEFIKNEEDCLTSISELDTFEQVGSAGAKDRTRAFLKIQDGCDAYCSYCIIPSLRGKPRSRKLESVVEEFLILLEKGYKEVVLVGIHIGKYGDDIGSSLFLLLKELAVLDGDFRIRLSSLEVIEISSELIRLVKDSHGKICPHFHIPLQSGSNTILKAMNRTYTIETYLKIVSEIRESIPNVVIGADVIVGFPGETDAHFDECLHTIEKAMVDYLHVFSFSEREGTRAAKMENKVDQKIIDKRAKKLRLDGESYKFNSAKKYFGKTVRVLVEGGNKGLTDTYFNVRFIKDQSKNKFVNAKIFGVQIDGGLAGEVIDE